MPAISPTPTSSPSSANRKLGGVVPLNFLTLLLTLSAVGIIVSTQKGAPKPDVYANACKSQIEGAVLDGVREITRTCIDSADGAPTPLTTKVPVHDGTIGFQYPDGWSVDLYGPGINPVTSMLWVAHLVPGPIFHCEGCDGPFINVIMNVGTKTDPEIAAHPDFKTYLDSVYSDKTVYSNISIQSVKEGVGERFSVTGNHEGLFTGTFETIYFVGTTQWSSVTFMDIDQDSSLSNDGWEIIKNSLDFSGIK